MKKKSLPGLLWLFLFVLIMSCQDNTETLVRERLEVPVMAPAATTPTKKNATGGRQAPTAMYWIQQDPATGEYRSAYGSGITFGTSFIHPTTVDPTGQTDGEPAPGFATVQFQLVPTLSSEISHNSFVLIQPTFGSPPPFIEVTAYLQQWKEYRDYVFEQMAQGNTHWDRPHPSHIGTPTGGGGVLEIEGMVVRDHTSPTNVSVVSIDYVYTPPVTPPSGGSSNLFLGTLVKDGNTFDLYGAPGQTIIGQVISIVATNSSGAIFSAPASLTYLLNYEGDQYHLTGQIKIGRNFTPIDDYIYTAW